MLRRMKYPSIINHFLSPSFPQWSSRNKCEFFSVPKDWRKTLFDTRSLTAQLIAISDGEFSVEVLWQGWRKINHQEAVLLNCKNKQHVVWCRDVSLNIKGKPRVYARTCIPKHTLTGNERLLTNLGSKPLGGFLFNHPNMSRGKMSAYRLRNNDLSLLWARHSVFSLNNKPVLVTEAFTQPLSDASL
jgi:chorismate--pyruvate lyase